MRQVLSNLLNNAAQHGDLGTQVLLSADGEDESIVLMIRNFGSVIPPGALQMIFEPLVQVPAFAGPGSDAVRTDAPLS